MTNDSLDFLNQNSQQEKPSQEEPKDEGVDLTIRADAECTAICDGDFLALLAANQITKIKVPSGQHSLQFISTEHPDIVLEKRVDFPVSGKNHVLLVSEFKALISAQKESEAEKAKNRANAEVIESIQKLIEYDEEAESRVLSSKISNFSGAIELLRKAAELGYAPAQYLLAELFYFGRDVPEDLVEWLQIAAKLDLAPIRDPEEAVKWWQKAAEQSDVDAQVWLADCYYSGEGAPLDYTEAAKWYRKAAEQGDADAQGKLAICFFDGKGVPQDYSEAVKWWRKAAEQGDADAQVWLAHCYYSGEGVPQDYSEAVKWWRKAAEQGDAAAQGWLGHCYYSGEGVPEDCSEAVKWWRKAAEQGDADAQGGLAICYYDGEGVPLDETEAVKWWRKAAEQGNVEAQGRLAICYYFGEGVPEDKTEAIKWWRKAAEQGDAEAISKLEVFGK